MYAKLWGLWETPSSREVSVQEALDKDVRRGHGKARGALPGGERAADA